MLYRWGRVEHMAEPMQVEVVSADRVVWSGKSSNIIAKTVEGEIGILPGHEPVLGVLEPSAVVIFCEDGPREVDCRGRRIHLGISGSGVDPERVRPDGRRDHRLPRPRRSWPRRSAFSTPATAATRIANTSLRATAQLRAAQKAQ